MLNQVRYFQAVVRLGSFTEAAEEYHISQSAISQWTVMGEDSAYAFGASVVGLYLTASGFASEYDDRHGKPPVKKEVHCPILECASNRVSDCRI